MSEAMCDLWVSASEYHMLMGLIREQRAPECFYRVDTNVKRARKSTTQKIQIGITPYGLGHGSGDIDLGGTMIYDSVDYLPEWMRKKLAVLVTLRFDVPTEELVGIGRRVSEHVFWVYACADERLGEAGGSNTRAKGKSRRKKTT